jgi:hypothetical protein
MDRDEARGLRERLQEKAKTSVGGHKDTMLEAW